MALSLTSKTSFPSMLPDYIQILTINIDTHTWKQEPKKVQQDPQALEHSPKSENDCLKGHKKHYPTTGLEKSTLPLAMASALCCRTSRIFDFFQC